jgi:hypothetical protein
VLKLELLVAMPAIVGSAALPLVGETEADPVAGDGAAGDMESLHPITVTESTHAVKKPAILMAISFVSSALVRARHCRPFLTCAAWESHGRWRLGGGSYPGLLNIYCAAIE